MLVIINSISCMPNLNLDLMMKKVAALQYLVMSTPTNKEAHLHSKVQIMPNKKVATLQCLAKMSLLSQYMEVNMGLAILATILKAIKFVTDRLWMPMRDYSAWLPQRDYSAWLPQDYSAWLPRRDYSALLPTRGLFSFAAQMRKIQLCCPHPESVQEHKHFCWWECFSRI